MLPLDFPGARRLIEAIDGAIRLDDETRTTRALCDALCEMIHGSDVRLPRCVFESVDDHYARRELYRSERFGYSVIAMTWGPRQGTPIHDHAGRWCVEGVWSGTLEVTPYDLVEQDGDRYRFEACECMSAGIGSTGRLIPPHEYHTIFNPSTDATAVSLHVYQKPLENCARFFPLASPWFRREDSVMTLDRVSQGA